ncbi:M20/M25/M40 family metallo-hydrolase [Pseudonocardia sp. C8]|nr:M28 family peptidase [Pseudonocardia sp. C8]MBC3191390.1 M20/M25/M40 family metallo-hydrolase [Pseudonocardia sp. C8]
MLAAGCAGPSPAPAAPAAPDGPVAQRVASTATGAGAAVHLEALQRIADGAGGNRASGGPGYERSVDYVAGVLRDAGFEVTTPEYDAGDGRRYRNVVARTRGGDPGAVVLGGAHLDSVPEGPGINDDGTGVAALLETAIRIGAAPGTRNTLAFGFWGSEEDELQGSTGYVRGLTGAERDAHLLYLNIDMVGSPNGGYFVQGGVGDGPEATGPDGSGAVARVLAEELAATGVQAEPIAFTGDDEAPFAEAGIPVAGAVTGDDETKTAAQAERWGGTAGAVYDACYHAACDDLGNVDRERLDRYTKAIAGTLARFADTAGRPAGP